MPTEEEIVQFAETLYQKILETFNHKDSTLALLTRDDATFPGMPGITAANIRNVLIGGHSSGTATYSEFIFARAEYDASYMKVSLKMYDQNTLSSVITLCPAGKLDITAVVEHLQRSTYIITQRIWDHDVQSKYIPKSHCPNGMLPQAAILALFGAKRKQRVALHEIELPLKIRISLLNECIKICNVAANKPDRRITEYVARRAYKRIVSDPKGEKRTKQSLCQLTIGFPAALTQAMEIYGYIDKWASIVNFNHTIPTPAVRKTHNGKSSKMGPKVQTHEFRYGNQGQSFWFMTIDQAFSDEFWETWISAIDEMRFCIGLGGKKDAYIRCSSTEEGAVFTTGGRFVYHATSLTIMEEKILRLAKFVMSFQRSYVEQLYGDDYTITWDANLLHHVVGPITNAVYGPHSDYSPLLCSLDPNSLVYVKEDVWLPERGEMQVLTIHCSNFMPLCNQSCTTITYTHEGGFIGAAPLGPRGIHIQGPGSQSKGIKHETSVCTEAQKAGIFRCVCTTRLTVAPNHGQPFLEAMELERTNPTDTDIQHVRGISSYNKISTVALSEFGFDKSSLSSTKKLHGKRPSSNPTFPIIGLASKKRNIQIAEKNKNACNTDDDGEETNGICRQLPFTERYPNVAPDQYESYQIQRSVPTITLCNRVSQLTTARALLCFLRKGYKVYIRREDKQIYPCIYGMGRELFKDEFLKYGNRYSTATICADAKVNHNDRSHAPIGTITSSANIIILTQKYKQNPQKINALIGALDRHDCSLDSTHQAAGQTIETQPITKVSKNISINAQSDFGKFSGRITIYGSGGCRKILGSFAPTTKCTKNDPQVTVGLGQDRLCPINKKLDALAASNSVQAVFLNENSYGLHTSTLEVENNLHFLGYFELLESSFVSGDAHKDISQEFNNPSDSEWINLTFRLHPHLRIEARPFVPTLEEVNQLLYDTGRNYQSIVFDHDDTSDITFHCVGKDGKEIGDWMNLNHHLGIEDVIEQMIDTGAIRQFYVNKNKKVPNEEYQGNNLDIDSMSEFDHEKQITDDSSDHETVPSTSDSNDNPIHYSGTGASIPEIVHCCTLNNVACALRYNRKSLHTVNGLTCAGPLTQTTLGVTLRTRPTPASNRNLDVILCYLRNIFRDHDALSRSIAFRQRCNISEVPLSTLTDMMFQIILLRYTGRVYRYEEFCLYQNNKARNHNKTLSLASLLKTNNYAAFLEYMKIDLDTTNATTLGRWVSKQHDGAISLDIRQNYYKFRRFLVHIASVLEDTVRNMLLMAQSESERLREMPNECINTREQCILELEKTLVEAMEYGGVTNFGRTKWMAYIAVSDVEEFVDQPFGIVNEGSVSEGNYSQLGHAMVNHARQNKKSFKESLCEIVSYVRNDASLACLNMLGYNKENNMVLNIINSRPFGEVDAEHFLCKAWLIAKLTFGHYRNSRYPKQCNNYTHPSPVVHNFNTDKEVEHVMSFIEQTYLSNMSGDLGATILLPEFCRQPGECII